MPRHSFIQMSKLPDLKGRISYAKQAVEMAIEQGEDVAMEWLKDKVN